jgi:DNA primase
MLKPAMRTLLLASLAAALGASSAFLVACGDRNDLIPAGDADALEADLDQADAACARNDRASAVGAVARAQSRAGELPPEVDAALRRTLNENLNVVRQRVAAQCQRRQTTQATQTTQTQATQPTETTQTTTTETEPPTTTTEPPPATTTTDAEPPSGGPGSGGTPGPGGGGSGGAGASD